MSTDTDPADMTTDAIRDRLTEIEDERAELDAQKEAADKLHAHLADARESLKSAARHDLTGDDARANLSLLKTMVGMVEHEGVHASRGVHHQRDLLRSEGFRLKDELERREATEER